ncbi:MAG: hypothetical protein UR54_C0023G0007 [Candidatus Roizmanbacteria bacterium GW2011_GWA2_34_18]|uniref:Uncharacterized protein n=1 Tax=Candidatus Roizmanbacteria bacterium GW2011_GWA2_34_18 TaxID=1618477 RepID=A0A0G0D8V8_9BACT|nr:MAG: hypothetical protein UR54_C0023G0007 [Candidatus Roizmanbacteria bacterium GW2011_GWA2_34_18]
MVRKRLKEKRTRRKLLHCFIVTLLETLFLITKKIRKLTQKNPHKINSIQRGEIWQLPASNKKGPIFPIFVKNLGEQLTPIPLTKGLKYQEKGKVKRTNETNKTIVLIKNLTEKPKRKKKIITANKI